MEVAGFNQLLQNMAQQDFFTGIFPFILSYVIFYLALQKAPIFKDQNTNRFSALIAIIFSFFVSYFLVMNPTYQGFFASYLSRVVIGIVGLLGLLVFLAFVPGFDLDNVGINYLMVLVVLAVGAAFTLSGGTEAFLPGMEIPGLEPTLGEVLQYTFESGLIYIIIIGTALWWVTKDPDSTRFKDWAEDAHSWGMKGVGE